MTIQRNVSVGEVIFSNQRPLVIIAGPCVLEKEQTTREIAVYLKRLSRRYHFPLVFKASYDKANRTSYQSYRGPGLEKGLIQLSAIKKEYHIPLLIDVHCRDEVTRTASVADILQIPAFLSRQTDLIYTCGKSGRVINLKKGQFLAPEDMENAIGKVIAAGNKNILLTERGTCFGYHNLVVDFRGITLLKRFGYPVIFDATHSVQLPGSARGKSGGQREFAFPLAKAAVAQGIAGLFLEVHPAPQRALSDGPNMLPLSFLPEFLRTIIRLDRLVKRNG